MKIFIDSADIDEIKQAFEWGIADGVTTNPSLMKKAVQKRVDVGQKLDLTKYITQICQMAKGTPVSLEVTETSVNGMVAQGVSLYKKFNPVAKNVYIKIPVNPAFADGDVTHFDGIKAIKKLTSLGIPTNCTLIFTPEQALLAAKAGASFVSPFCGRIDDYIRSQNKVKFNKTDYYPKDGAVKGNTLLEDNGVVSGIDLVQQCVEILQYYELPTQVLAASLRNPRQVRDAAIAGSHISTLPLGVIQDMLKHHKTYEGMKKFTEDIVPEYVNITRGKKGWFGK
jgi:transaldolase